MDHYTMKALWIYWARGDDEVELTDEESSDFDEVAKIFRIDTNDDWIYEWNKDVPWVHERPWTENEVGNHLVKTSLRNLLGAYIIGNTPLYQDLEWHDALKDNRLKDEALKNKAIMEGMIDNNDKSSNNSWRRWDSYEIPDHDQEEREYENEHEDEERSIEYVGVKEDEYKDLTSTNEDACRAYKNLSMMDGRMVYEIPDHDQEEREYENEHEDEERCELFNDHELRVYIVRRFEMIKYSFEQDEEYVDVKEDKYEDLTSTSEDACRAYRQSFAIDGRRMVVKEAE
ncbi:hypothetical protein Tco_0307961 [Tanacetum coccineum]